MIKTNFASDNYAGTHPAVFEWLKKVNDGPAAAYGADPYTGQVREEFKKHFGEQAEPYIVFNGTGANVIALKSAIQSFESILCSDIAHIQEHECGAVERLTGAKLALTASENGKINPITLAQQLRGLGDQHMSQPRVVSISQSTEYGTVYTLKEIRAIAEFCKSNGLFLHLDGARLSNAAVSLGCTFKEMTTDCGVDLVCFGGTKNGLMGAEAVVVLNPMFNLHFNFIRKQGLQLASKMRFLSAQFLAYFENELWRKNASHANQMAKLLEKKLCETVSAIKITRPVDANVVFAVFPKSLIQELSKRFSFYTWNESLSEVRLMCSFQTTEAEIEDFVTSIEFIVKN